MSYRGDTLLSMSLTRQEVMKVVNRFIGVSAEYLGDFSYRTHEEFYPEYCDLNVDPNTHPGTTRERFIEILSTRSPHDQAALLRPVMPVTHPARAHLGAGVGELVVAAADTVNPPRRIECGEGRSRGRRSDEQRVRRLRGGRRGRGTGCGHQYETRRSPQTGSTTESTDPRGMGLRHER